MRSVMSHNFAQVPRADIPRSQFNRSHGLKTTFNAGQLVPIFIDEALPGDTFNLKMNMFGRLATPIVPIMDNLFLDTFYFAVPYRLVWDNWQKFNGEQINPGDSTDYLIPQTTSPASTGWTVGSLADHFGLPTGVPGLAVSALPGRAYKLIWNEWFRDQNLQSSVVISKGDGPDPSIDAPLLRRGKRHDYFTSALPWPQKGPAVTLPLGSSAAVVPNSATTTPTFNFSGVTGARKLQGNSSSFFVVSGSSGPSSTLDAFWADTGLKADLTTATATTINALRQAFQIQKLLERDARGGTRYTEIVRAHFGVTSPDMRLQRPEYLGGGSVPINVHPIAQTSATGTGATPQGNLAAMGTVSGRSGGFVKSFTEHTIIIGLACVRADLNYQQGLNRMWSRRGRFDFYWPALAHIGEQAILNKEIYAQGSANPTADAAVFGYQERYAEYRYKPSEIHGQFRSTFSTPLDIWHLAQKFDSLPTLNATFIEENPPVNRVIAVPSYPHILLDAFFDLKTARPMPTYSVPGLIDHF